MHAPFVLHVRVSKLSDSRYELLIFHHELTEALLCREAGVTTEMVDAFDKAYEAARADEAKCAPCGCEIQEEPGDDIHCPCFKQHRIATQMERIMAKALAVNWDVYDKEVESL